jgi:hypothetical protein
MIALCLLAKIGMAWGITWNEDSSKLAGSKEQAAYVLLPLRGYSSELSKSPGAMP